MATAADVIQTFIKLGSIVKTAASSGGSADWGAVLAAILKDPAASKTVSGLFDQLKGSAAIDGALAGIRKKEQDLLAKANAKDASDLSGLDLLNYHALADAELALATKKMIGALDAGFLGWVVDDALPALTSVLPLLLAA